MQGENPEKKLAVFLGEGGAAPLADKHVSACLHL